MNKVAAFIRRNLNRAALIVYRAVYRLLPKKRKKWLFEKDITVSRLDTGVKIIEKTNGLVKIGKFEQDGSFSRRPFRILTTTDLHLGDEPDTRRKTMQMLANNIVKTKPDLVIFTGDIVLSKFQQLDAVQFARFMEKTGVYWAITFGNHEAREEKGFFKWLLLDSVSRYPHCLSTHGDDSLYGYGNCEIDIMDGNDSLLNALFLLDSGRDIRDEYREQYGIPADMKGYDFIKTEQIEWYRSRVTALKEEYGTVKSMMYFHIPFPEFNVFFTCEDEKKHIFTQREDADILYGGMFESVGCSPYNSGLFDVITELGSTQAVFCGHDHVNDFCGLYRGVYLVYSQCGGYDTYTATDLLGWSEDRWVQGVTLTDIDDDGDITINRRFNREYLKK